MEPAAYGFIGSLFGALVGASASIATTAINARHSLRLQAVSKEWEKAEKFSVFQRETLLAVQIACQNLARLMTEAHIEHRKTYAASGQWAEQSLEKELNEGLGEANRALFTVAERVADNQLRGKIKQMHANITTVYLTRSPDEAHATFLKVGQEFVELMEQLGSALRSLY
jgi:hypothetical protein